ncbi:MAG: mitochondrial branched-chain alpha-ketoacid dehydrogenase kinase-domain-containing protein [Podila humilis]|nr:MAG: mitochondrial branched-chain alpha-ketoacid dehydrogenase kinase-domain-containing protein [Podila humilis]
MYRITPQLSEKIKHFATFPQTGVSLRQMVMFGQNPTQGTLFKASQFLSEELPIRLAHRVKELEELPHNLSDMPSIIRVKNWYAQSFQDLVEFPSKEMTPRLKDMAKTLSKQSDMQALPENSPNLALPNGSNPNGRKGVSLSHSRLFFFLMVHRYHSAMDGVEWPAEVNTYNEKFTKMIEAVKRRHDPVVTTVGKFEGKYNYTPIQDSWQLDTRASQRKEEPIGDDTICDKKMPTVFDLSLFLPRSRGRKRFMADGNLIPDHTFFCPPNCYSLLVLASNQKKTAQGILEFKQSKMSHLVDTDVQAFLDRFYMSRIGIRMLIGQHIALNKGPSRKDYVGIICTKTNLADIAQEAIDNAKFICEDYYGLFRGPEVHLHCKKDLEFMYVPSHLSHMLFELLKNSLRAVVEQYGTECDEYPPIKLIVAQGKEDIAIKISDEGGGIPRSGVPLVWTYMYTTAPSQHLDPTFDKSDFKAPMAGFGYGLPISRLYARYFGGDLKLISMEGYGTDVYLHLNRISNSDEPLP